MRGRPPVLDPNFIWRCFRELVPATRTQYVGNRRLRCRLSSRSAARTGTQNPPERPIGGSGGAAGERVRADVRLQPETPFHFPTAACRAAAPADSHSPGGSGLDGKGGGAWRYLMRTMLKRIGRTKANGSPSAPGVRT